MRVRRCHGKSRRREGRGILVQKVHTSKEVSYVPISELRRSVVDEATGTVRGPRPHALLYPRHCQREQRARYRDLN